jgi:hypothetical protein
MNVEFTGRSFNPEETLAQIGKFQLVAISGLRWSTSGKGREVYVLHLPVGHGYRVDIELAADDTYTVRRVFKRGDKETVKGELKEVYFDKVGDAAYYASCYVSYDETEWPQKSLGEQAPE